MGYMSASAKILNMKPKKNSKAQKQKRKLLSKLTHKVIGCKKCHKTNTTLYNIQGHYYCKDCKQRRK